MSDIVERLQFEYGFGDRLEAAEEILRLRAENEKLRAALKPFADEVPRGEEYWVGHDTWQTAIPARYFRAAAAALKEMGDD